MDAELLCALLHQLFVAVDHLLLGHAVLGIAGLVHDLKALFALAQLEGPAGVIAAEDLLRHPGHPLQKLHHGGVIQIDVSAQLVGLLYILHGGLVGGEHDLVAGKAAGLAEHQLGQGGAVHAAALLLEDLQDDRVRQCLDRKVLLEALVPAEGLVDAADILPDALFVVDVERVGTSSMISCAIASVRNGFFSIITSLSFCAARHVPACGLSHAAQCRNSSCYSFRFSRVG